MVSFDIFTDAASRNNNKKNEITISSSAAFLVFNRVPRNYVGTYNIDASNNVGELGAILEGLQHTFRVIDSMESMKTVQGLIPINIYSDSTFCIKGLTVWYKTWVKTLDAEGNWINSSGKPVANQHIFKQILSLVNIFKSRYRIKFIYVPGHVGENAKKTVAKCRQAFKTVNGYDVDDETFAYYNEMNKMADLIANKTIDNRGHINGWIISDNGKYELVANI